MHGGERTTRGVDSALLSLEKIPNGLNHALVHKVEESAQKDAGEVDLGGCDLPRVFGLFIEITNQTSSLLNTAAIVLLLLRRHVDRLWRETTPL